MAAVRRSSRRLVFLAVAGLLTFFLYQHTRPAAPRFRPSEKAFVVASQKSDDTSWISSFLPDWDVYRYVTDDPKAQYTVPLDKGRDANVYLTYIIDAYEQLPDVIVFMHGARYQWHNDHPVYDGVPLLQSLQLPYIVSQGYASLRCAWLLGCPHELRFDVASRPDQSTQMAYPQAWMDMFPGETLPLAIGATCGAQFAVTAETIRSHPREDYIRWRQWLLDTPLADAVSARILEYSWHIIFGKPAVQCPSAEDCYCNTFGLCDLECANERGCGERWPYPPSSTLPKAWPYVGWEGEIRGPKMLAEMNMVAMKRNRTGP